MNVVNSDVVIDKLDDLADVVITDNLKDGQLLQYDEIHKIWGNVTIESAEDTKF